LDTCISQSARTLVVWPAVIGESHLSICARSCRVTCCHWRISSRNLRAIRSRDLLSFEDLITQSCRVTCCHWRISSRNLAAWPGLIGESYHAILPRDLLPLENLISQSCRVTSCNSTIPSFNCDSYWCSYALLLLVISLSTASRHGTARHHTTPHHSLALWLAVALSTAIRHHSLAPWLAIPLNTASRHHTTPLTCAVTGNPFEHC
jgi:hypothetical protein